MLMLVEPLEGWPWCHLLKTLLQGMWKILSLPSFFFLNTMNRTVLFC